VEDSSLSEIIYTLSENISRESAKCLLTGLVIYTENFKKNLTADIFQTISDLIKKGASLEEITNNIK
jgi:nanoRNase/pAp phosphatase (c-di-AMP/oligoRNAs hydrolase)